MLDEDGADSKAWYAKGVCVTGLCPRSGGYASFPVSYSGGRRGNVLAWTNRPQQCTGQTLCGV